MLLQWHLLPAVSLLFLPLCVSPQRFQVPRGEPLQSPCPSIFSYDGKRSDDRWYGVILVSVAESLSGLRLDIYLDRPAQLLGNWEGEVKSKDNVHFTIWNPNKKLYPGPPISVRIFVKFEETGAVPYVQSIRLNGREICPEPVSLQNRPSTSTSFNRPVNSESGHYTTPRPLYSGAGPEFESSRPNYPESKPDHVSSGPHHHHPEFEPEYSSSRPVYPQENSEYETPRPIYIQPGIEHTTSRPIYTQNRPEYTTSKTRYTEYTPDYTTSRTKYTEQRPEYTTSRTRYTEQRPEYTTSRTRYTEQRPEYTTSRTKYTEQRPEYTTSRTKYTEQRPEYTTSRTKYTEQRPDYTTSRTKYTEQRPEYTTSSRTRHTTPRPEYTTSRTRPTTYKPHTSSSRPIYPDYESEYTTRKTTRQPDEYTPRQTTSRLPDYFTRSTSRRTSTTTYRPHTRDTEFTTRRTPSPTRPTRSPTRNPEEYLSPTYEGCGRIPVDATPLITHGQKTARGQWPWHVALYQSKGPNLTYICGGSLVSQKSVITAAHCVTKTYSTRPVDPDTLLLYLGKYHLKLWSEGGVQSKQVDRIHIHPSYNSTSYHGDIAILILTSPVDFTFYVKPVCIWSKGEDIDDIVTRDGTVVGWGYDESGMVTEELMMAKMPVVAQQTCIWSKPEFFSRFTSNATYCAGFRNGTSVCNGDSGGGMVFPIGRKDNEIWYLRGIVSISVSEQDKRICNTKHYVVFTDVSKYADWIKHYLL